VALTTVNLTGTYIDGLGNALAGYVLFVPNVPLTDAAGQQLMRQAAISITLDPDGHFSVPLIATDDANLAPEGWVWTVKEVITGIAPRTWSFFLPSADGDTQDISSLDAVVLAPPVAEYLAIEGGTLTGPLTLAGAPTTSLMAATKAYVDAETTRAEAAESGKLLLTGGTMTGAIVLPANPSASLQAAPKQYVDAETTRAEAAEAVLLPLAGGTIPGTLILSGTSPLQITHGAASGDILTSNGTGQASWQPSGSGVTLDSTSGDIAALGTQAAGTNTQAARADHVHPATSIINGVTVSGSPSSGKSIVCTSGSAATWSTPAAGVTLDTSDNPAALGSASPGVSGQASPADHVHPSTSIINGVTVSGTAAAGKLIVCSSSSAAAWGTILDSTATDIQPLGSRAAGSTGLAADAGHIHPTTSVINGVTVSGTPASGKIIVCTSSSAASWSALTDATASDIQALASSAAAGSVGTPADAGHVHPYTGLALLAGAAFTGVVSTTKALTAGVFVLTYATTVSVDASQGNHFRLTLTASTATMGTPTNLTDGQKITFEIIQDGTGGRTVAFSSAYIFGTAGAPSLTATASARDILGFIYSSSKGKWIFAGSSLGF
jgi:hypothetical protein